MQGTPPMWAVSLRAEKNKGKEALKAQAKDACFWKINGI